MVNETLHLCQPKIQRDSLIAVWRHRGDHPGKKKIHPTLNDLEKLLRLRWNRWVRFSQKYKLAGLFQNPDDFGAVLFVSGHPVSPGFNEPEGEQQR